jgi:hypothetical protein
LAKFTSKTTTQETAIVGSSDGEGVHGDSTSLVVAAIAGIQLQTAPGSKGAGVYGESRGEGAGVAGFNLVTAPGPTTPSGSGGSGGPGGVFSSVQKEAIIAHSNSLESHTIAAYHDEKNGTGAALYAKHAIGVDGKDGTAGYFEGNVVVTGDISLPNADCAEHFTIKDEVFADAGTVMALSETGELVPCVEPYERKVVGVVAGAGTYRPGIIMDSRGNSVGRRQPIALLGKVFCKVDAGYGAIEVGDLLTSSATNGHAMKARDTTLAFGAVIGKAMAPLDNGLGLIPILISLQ